MFHAGTLILALAVRGIAVTAPGVPALSSPVNGIAGEPILQGLSWDTAFQATSYTVQVATASAFGTTAFGQTGSQTTALLSNLSPSTTYYWRVQASDSAGPGVWSAWWSFTTVHFVYDTASSATMSIEMLKTIDPTFDGAPLGAYDEVGAFSKAGLCVGGTVWDSVHNKNVNVVGQDPFSRVPDGLNGGDSIYFRVWRHTAQIEAPAAVTFSKGHPIFNPGAIYALSGLTAQVPLPSVPLLSSPVSGSGALPAALSLDWSSSAGASTYSVQASTDSTFGTFAVDDSGISATSVSLSGLGNNVTCYWRVSAENPGGPSAWSTTWSFTTLVNAALPVEAGWNIVSLNIRPVDSSAAAVFGDSASIANRHNFILVKTLSGGVYMPTLGIDDSIVMQTGVGCQVYSDSTDTIPLVGLVVPAFSTPIVLPVGWSLLGYLPQTDLPVADALSGIVSQVMLVKDNDGEIYWPDYGIDEIDSLLVGQGYFVYMKSPATFTYADSGVAKRRANAGTLLRLPRSRHFAKHANTGSNASVLVTRVTVGTMAASDSCEIGAFDAGGNPVGSGTVLHGMAAFPVWGQNTQTGRKDGLRAMEPITFRLWNAQGEFPAAFQASDGGVVRYAPQGIFLGTLAVSEGALIREYNLTGVYPNPFRGSVRIAFDVPAIAGVTQHALDIGVYDLRGNLVKQLVNGMYPAGHYAAAWDCHDGHEGAGVYTVRLRAENFDKRLKLVRLRD
jgi:hypothetical protein